MKFLKHACLAFVVMTLCTPGLTQEEPDVDASQDLAPRVSTNNYQVETYLDELAPNYEGGDGQWTFELYDVDMLLLTDEAHDRVRLISPVADASVLEPGQLRTLMEANFDRALDAKYAIWRDAVWATFVHPLSELTKSELRNAIRQVANLRRNYGGSYSSTELLYRVGAP